MNGSVIYEQYYHMVNRIASEYAKKFNMVDKSDISQELWLWFMTHPNKVDEWTAMDSQKDSDKLIAKSLRNAALDYCVNEKAKSGGYSPDDIFWYTKDFIKMLIPAVLSNDWSKLENALSSEGKQQKVYAESGDWMAYAADIKQAFERLEKNEQELVQLFYAEDVDGQTLHEAVGEDKPTARATMMQANRALNKMVRNLGGFAPYKDEDNESSDMQ